MMPMSLMGRFVTTWKFDSHGDYKDRECASASCRRKRSTQHAARKGYWNFDHEAFDGVRRFLRTLAQDRPAA
jgi:hypothetical protein